MIAVVTLALAWDGTAEFAPYDPDAIVRVEDPDHPDAIVRSATGSVLPGPPGPGVKWRHEPVAWTDAVAFEALEVTNADLWHADGHTGAGVRVAVFDPNWQGADPAELGAFTTHDCVTHRTCEVPFDPLLMSGGHGVACAEVIRDLAPDVELFLVRTSSFTSVENGVRWAIRNDIDVISMSTSYYNDSFHDGTGPFAPLLQDLEDHDILLVTSAGNTAQEHWTGRFVDADLDGRLDFDGSNRLEFEVREGDGRRVTLAWDQFDGCGRTDLDLRVVDLGGDVLGRSEGAQDPPGDDETASCEPVEVVRYFVEQAGRYAVEVHHRRGALADVDVSIFVRGGRVLDASESGGITVPADHPLAFAVGAVRADLYRTAGPESFSARGPSLGGHAKPDIAGPDRLSTSVFGDAGFTGTSASTPAVAALIAVRLSAAPGSTPRDAAHWLQSHALSDRTVWEIDPELGAGRARLPLPEVRDAGCHGRPLLMPLLVVPVWRRWVRCRR